MIPPGRPMDRETLAQAIAALRSQWANHCGTSHPSGCCLNDAIAALEQLRDAAQREEERPGFYSMPFPLPDWVRVLGSFLRHKADCSTLTIPLGAAIIPRCDCGLARAERDAADQVARLMAAPVGGQTPPTYDYEPFIPKDECFTSDMLRKVAGHLESGLLTFTDSAISTPEWITALRVRADRLEAEANRVGGQTPTEPVLVLPKADWSEHMDEVKKHLDTEAPPFVGPFVPRQTPTEPPPANPQLSELVVNAEIGRVFTFHGWTLQMAKDFVDGRMQTCEDCTLPYRSFPLDTILPDDQWKMIHPLGDGGGTLCAHCIVQRASRLKGAVVVHARIEFGLDIPAAPPPPGAPAAFTRAEVEFRAKFFDTFDTETARILRAYAKTLPTEGRQETR